MRYPNWSNLSVFRKVSMIIAALGIVLGSFFANTKPAASQQVEPEDSLTLGKLAYSTTIFTASGNFSIIRSANADGSGESSLTSFPPNSFEPIWSPTGAKIAFTVLLLDFEIFAMNPDGTGMVNLTNTMGVNERYPDWSSTGKIAYERDSQIWTMNSDGTNQAQFPGIIQPSPTAPVWSPNGSMLAFSSGGEIWVINADGTGERRVTNNMTADSDPAWSQTGTKIVFTKGTSGIGIVDLDGSNETNLTTGNDDRKPAWSNDGTKIAFVRRGTAVNGIYVMDTAGGNQVRVVPDVQTNRGTENDSPAWQPVAHQPNTFSISGRITRAGASLTNVIVNLSGTTNAAATTDAVGDYYFSNLAAGGNYSVSPSFTNHFFTPANRIFNALDSNKIADFVAAEVCTTPNCESNGKIAFTRDLEIFTMNSDGTGQTNITNHAATESSPNYSPDGSKIIFSTNRDGNNEIYRMNSDGGSPIRLTNNSASDTSPVYSPDGSSIAFVSNRDGNDEIYKMNADGTNQVRLTNDPRLDLVPSYSPDGTKIIFVVRPAQALQAIFTMNADGTNQQMLSDAGSFYNRPSYSPDGSKIIFVFGIDVTAQNIWTMNADGTNRQQFPVGRSSPTYSPDGTKVTHVCCFFAGGPLQNGIRLANADGGSPQALTTGMFDDLPDWQPILSRRRVKFDFDGDGRADASVFRPADGIWHLLGSQAGYSGTQFGLSDDNLTPADYDGDLKTDVAVWRNSDGNFYILNSSNGTMRVENFGLPGDIPTVGDWDGDGKADLSVYRGGAQGVFYYRASSNNPNGNISNVPWGVAGDKPVIGDFDGDGRSDAAVFRPSNGVWYIRKSSDGQLLAYNFGLANDKLVPADYDGDGKTDIAVYRNGIWYILRSTDGGFGITQFGISSDIPVPADYNGDGKAEIAVFRGGVWYILQASNGAANIFQFGIAADKPIPAAIIP